MTGLSTSNSYNSGAEDARPIGGIEASLKDLGAKIIVMDSIITDLEARLGMVLLPVPVVAPGSCVAREIGSASASSVLTNRIRLEARQVSDVCDRMCDLLDRLEL